MILDAFGELNWWAVVVAALAFFVLGSLWYSPLLFGKQYRAATGVQEGESLAETAKRQGLPQPGVAILVNLIMWLIAAIALGLIATALGTDMAWDGIVLGLVVAIGFIGTNRVAGRVYGEDNPKLMPINAPYTLIGYALMGLIFGVM